MFLTEKVLDSVQEASSVLEEAPGIHSFADNLKYMGLGMLGIFVAIGIIVGITYILNKVFKAK